MIENICILIQILLLAAGFAAYSRRRMPYLIKEFAFDDD